ncbi:MAG TPA: hypothetical protein VLQ93_14675 [Myxococcaceae bacterium]|nr:hypothetical protein [Myxococcaceae bacterium]
MPKQHVDTRNLEVHAVPEQHGSLQSLAEGVTVVITQAFGPRGDNLVGISDVKFDGYPAVTLLLRTPDGREGLVHLSPIHGDKRKQGFTDIAPGTRCTLLCPVSKQPLEKLGPADDGSGADYYALYLTPKLSRGDAVMVTDIWEHYHSRIVDNDDLISYWARTHE